MKNNCETVYCYANKQFNDIQNQIILYKNNNMPFIVVIFIFFTRLCYQVWPWISNLRVPTALGLRLYICST